ncbi:MAG: outer membrane protein assembly factor BamE [Herminiimonas sp.]|nr:outer membrane protein assembly factor BamE [Herminiimonas sp.]
MKHLFHAVLAVLLSMLGACAGFGTVPVNAGDTESQVVAKLGKPTHRYQNGTDHLLEYMNGPFGQTTYMARIGPDNRLISYEQVLTTQKFAMLKPGQATKDDVLHTIGAPSDTSYLPLSELEVWSYPYKESNVWNSLMNVHFDKTGIVRRMQNGPDPRHDPDSRFPFGLMGL